MITVNAHGLVKLGLDPDSPLRSVQLARDKIYGSGSEPDQGESYRLIFDLIGLQINPDDFNVVKSRLIPDFALMVAQGVTDIVVRHVGQPIDEVDVLVQARDRAMKLLNAPQHKWMFAKTEAATTAGGEVRAVAAGVEMKVEVKADGKIKKGGKEILATELYKLHVVNAATPVANTEFVAILMKELGMSKAGATTYAWNVKRKFKTG